MKCIWKYFKVWFFLFFLFLLFKIFAYMLPDDGIRRHVSESYQIMIEEGLYPKIGYPTDDIRISQQIDGYTDAIYLNVAYEAGAHDVISAVAADYCGGAGEDPLAQLGYRIDHIGENVTVYGRQWFGAMTYIRPLLVLFNLAEIRYMLQIVFWLLLIISYRMLSVRLNNKIAMSFLLGMLSIAPFAIGFSFNILNVFLVVFIMIIVICCKYRKGNDIGIYLFLTGALTAYLDLFLTPFVSFGVISLIMLYYDYILNGTNSIGHWIISVVKCALSWVIGYFSIWIAKWIYGSVVLNENMFLNAWMEMKNASGGSVPWGPSTKLGYITESLKLNFSKVFPYNYYLIIKDESELIANSIVIILFVILFVYWLKNRVKIGEVKIIIAILAVTVSPYVYYIIMHFHTYVHYWVEYRYQCIVIMGITLLYMIITEKKKPSERNVKG